VSTNSFSNPDRRTAGLADSASILSNRSLDEQRMVDNSNVVIS